MNPVACLSILLTLLLSATAIAQQPKRNSLKVGLEVNEYPRQSTQTSLDKVFVEAQRFDEPIGKAYLIDSLNGWKYTTERNAIACGFLHIKKAGEYQFVTDSFYDRNVLKVNGDEVCKFADGGSNITTVTLNKGLVPIESIGYVDGRGGTQGVRVQWRPPGQRELSDIPPTLLLHRPRKGLALRDQALAPVPAAKLSSDLRARWLTVVAKDFVIEVYRNGRRIADADRKLLLDRFGASVERIDVDVKAGDWLVFHVAHNRLRHKGSKFFAVAGCLDDERFGFVSDPRSEAWSVCDDAGRSAQFIRHRDQGTEARAMAIAHPWEEGRKFMEKYTGREFPGQAVWGTAPSTWIKCIVPEESQRNR